MGISINGRNISVGGNVINSVVSTGDGQVIINGKVVASGLSGVVTLKVEGDVIIENLECESSVQCGNVSGDVKASGSVTCKDVSGSVKASGSVHSGTVYGDVKASGSVHCSR